MYEYLFLFVLAALWSIFASIQDIRSTEISDWLTFSLLIIALGYRAIYSFFIGDSGFFLYGLGGTALFLALSYLFYYSNFFAGGDAKLLIAFGAILPFDKMFDYLTYGVGFVFVLFLVGAVYSILLSVVFMGRRFGSFKKSFAKNMRNNKWWIFIGTVLCAFLLFFNSLAAIFAFILIFLFIYLKSVDEGCMIELLQPGKLREGDWIVGNVSVGNRIIKKTVHGLTKEDIAFLIKHKKSIMIKKGVPFAPCFFVAFALMVVFFLRIGDFSQLLAYFF